MLTPMRRTAPPTTTPLWAVLLLTGLVSLGAGAFWFGLSFIARHAYGFDPGRNLLFHALLGAVYVAGSLGSGPLSKRLTRSVSTRRLLAALLLGQALCAVVPVVWQHEVWLWFAAISVSWLSALMWPVIESYLGSGRQGGTMRRALGQFNLVWMTAMAIPMLGMGPLIEHHARTVLGAMALVHFLALAALPWFRPNPRGHASEEPSEEVPARYRYLLRSSRYLLPSSYVLLSVISPLLPYRMESLGIAVAWQTPTVATWMIVRVLVVAHMSRSSRWHGRWTHLVVAGASLGLGFFGVLLAAHPATMIAALACLGAGLAMTHFAGLYYALSVGQAEVEAGGTHEALMGLGYTIGPLIGWVGLALGGHVSVVGLTSAWMVGAAWRACRPYQEELRQPAPREGQPTPEP